MSGYAIVRTVRLPFEAVVDRVRDALAREGFGVLTEIDIRATLKKKLDADFRPYLILGACNPPLAKRALEAELDVGVLLPCNIAVYEGDEPGETVISAMDPAAALALANNDAIRPLADDVRARIVRVVEGVA